MDQTKSAIVCHLDQPIPTLYKVRGRLGQHSEVCGGHTWDAHYTPHFSYVQLNSGKHTLLDAQLPDTAKTASQ